MVEQRIISRTPDKRLIPVSSPGGGSTITIRLVVEPTYLFLDTEWADVLGAELVSLALVSADGRHRFYAERNPLPANPTDFVKVAVYPLLDRDDTALSDAAFTTELRRFLCAIDAPCVLFDYFNDRALLWHALASALTRLPLSHYLGLALVPFAAQLLGGLHLLLPARPQTGQFLPERSKLFQLVLGLAGADAKGSPCPP